MIGIYVLRNKINGKEYVGQSVNLEERMYSHKSPCRQFIVIDHAINKYGWDNFEQHLFIVPEDWLDYFEIEMIKKRNCMASNGYNIKEGGSPGRHNEESKRNISKAKKGKYMGADHCRARPIMCVETGKIYGAAMEAGRETGINRGHIGAVALHKRKTAGGYHWRFV